MFLNSTESSAEYHVPMGKGRCNWPIKLAKLTQRNSIGRNWASWNKWIRSSVLRDPKLT
jgi:hypothetical protein